MTDAQAGPPAGDRDAETSPGATDPATPGPARMDAGTRPVVATVSLLGGLVTGLCLAAVDRLDDSAPARILAVVAVVTALVAVVVALGGQLSGMLARPAPAGAAPAGRRGALAVLSAGVLSGLAVVLAGAAALVVVQAREAAAVSTEPEVAAQRGRTVAGTDTVTAQLSFPGLPAGSVLNATMESVQEGNRFVLTRSAVRVGADGSAVVQLVAPADPDNDIVIGATAPGLACTVQLPSAVSESTAAVNCTPR